MYSDEIQAMLSDVDGFVGVFPSNHLPNVGHRPASFVVNTAPIPDKYGGDHWVAVILKQNSKGEYFDSFGLPPLEHNIADYINKTCSNGYKYSMKMIQGRSSSLCGLYCVDFIRQRLVHKKGFDAYLAGFNTDFKANDRLVVCRQSWQSFAPQLLSD